jgi:putative transposase
MRAPFTQLYVHLVWSTWDRAPLITPEIRTRLYAAMLQTCKELKCDPIVVGGIDDHVHLLVHIHPSIAIADLVKNIKGNSSHLANHEIAPAGNFRWQGAYGAFTIRKEDVDLITAYILNQSNHHEQNDLFPSFEQSDIAA